MRYDIFIIWGNGLVSMPEIMDTIRNDPNYEIVRIKRHKINQMKKFIEDVYFCDNVPMQHLIAKTRYLMTAPREAFLVLVKNLSPDEKFYGEGAFGHIQCGKIKSTKNIIRNQFNPRFSDKNKQILPLDRGISHEHCIHATDYESQVDHLLSAFGLENLKYHSRYNELEICFPFHLNFSSYKIIEVELDSLYANIIKENGVVEGLKIEETPHYQYVSGNRKPYIKYFAKYFGIFLQEDHFPKSFDKLIREFDINYQTHSGKKTYIIVQKNTIRDGLHRASILKHLGIERIKCIQIS